MTLSEHKVKFLHMEAQLILKAIELGTPIMRLEWLRSVETQRIYVARGASKTMKSQHIEGLASDFCFLSDLKDDGKLNYSPDKYKVLGEFWESLGGEWGGRYGDNLKTEKIEGWDAGHFGYRKENHE